MTIAKTALEAERVKIVEPHTLDARLNKLSEEISHRAYEIFENNGRRFGHDLEDWFNAESEILPPFDLGIRESVDSLTVEAKVPGFRPNDLAVSLEPWQLTISGEKETKEEQTKGEEIYQGQYSKQLIRVIDLPSEINSSKATATFKDGLLVIMLPKAAEAASACCAATAG